MATTPTTADLYALHGGRERLLTVREAANQLGVGTWTIYRLCETGELAHVGIIDRFGSVLRTLLRSQPPGDTEQHAHEARESPVLIDYRLLGFAAT